MQIGARHVGVAIALALALAGCGKGLQTKGPAAIDAERLVNADSEPGNWMTHGRTYSEQRFSPLSQINADNVGRLGLAWSYDLDTHRGQESTPLVIDGVMYVTTAWSKVRALDAATGKLIWDYDPHVPGGQAVYVCCDVVNRGAAAWDGKIYFGTLDARFIALDAQTGKKVWEVQTGEHGRHYAITGAPRIVKGMVLIGNGGAEYDARGYVTAYDAETGKQIWRFYTVPGNPADGFENKTMEMAAKTWTGEWWKLGGGGTVWDAIVYDPQTDLVYIGTGNGLPWDSKDRNADGRHDNLFIASIVALKAETGEYVWHYQEAPGESWDFDSDQPIMTADLVIGGEKRHVVMQAPKDGFFYVLDAVTGKLISAKPYTDVNWARGIDMTTGRPIENAGIRYAGTGKQADVVPGSGGGHNWQPWAFNPHTGLVYIPEMVLPGAMADDPNFMPSEMAMNLGTGGGGGGLPPPGSADRKALEASLKGAIVAWDPVKQEARWRVDHQGPWNGGILSTGGNLIVQGVANGEVEIRRADTGDLLWSFRTQTGVLAGPVSYTAGGEQYIAVAVGWGGVMALPVGPIGGANGAATQNISRILAFKLGGTGR